MSSSSEKSSVAPQSHASTVFGESNLGEPLAAQHLVLDFTPKEELDNDIVQRKCCAFWDYIKSRTDLHHMLVLPDEKVFTKTSEDAVTTGSEFVPIRIGNQQKTAVSMLEFAEGQGLIDRIFEAKLKQSHCTLGSREYHENEPTKPAHKEIITCTCSKICKSCRNILKQGRDPASGPQSPDVQALCKKLQAWDNDHPKSMNPPGHPPALTHCIMQRKVIM